VVAPIHPPREPMEAAAGPALQGPPSITARYLAAVALPLLVALLTLALRSVGLVGLGPAFSVAVAIASVYGGWGPGALASALSLAGYFLFPDLLEGPLGTTRLIQFVVISIVITWAGGTGYRERWRAVREAMQSVRLRQVAEQATAEAQQQARNAEAAAVEAEVAVQEAAEALSALTEAEAALRAKDQAQAELYEKTARFTALVASSRDAIIGKALDGTITSWNPGAEEIFGYSAAEMIGASVFRLVPEELHAAERDVLERLTRGESVAISEVERVRKDGQRIWISLSVSPIRDASGRIVGAASIKRDITERRLADERQRDTQRLRAVGQLAGGVAHEANNQMLVVLGAVHFLLRRGDLPPAAQNDLLEIRHAAERTAAITQQLLAFGRRQALRLETIDMNRVVDRFMPVLRRTMSEQHQLRVELTPEALVVRVDPQQIDQVLLNLALNSRDAMPEGGIITVRTSRSDAEPGHPPPAGQPGESAPTQYACLVVQDTGHGMDAATLRQAFEPFFTTKGVGQGTGLGLSVVDGIVSQSGGFVRVTSTPGQGATFSLYFPLAAVASSAAETKRRTPPPAAEGRSVLVVEDEPTVRTMAVRTLEEAGYRVRQAAHGREALALIEARDGRVDLVVTDLGMPEMDGHELASRLKTLRPGLPVLYMSGYGDAGVVTPFLQKPFSPDDLVDRVAAVLAGVKAEKA
jgi:two-component system, cell cycle sensor histidine kinase and response regulator CckA